MTAEEKINQNKSHQPERHLQCTARRLETVKEPGEVALISAIKSINSGAAALVTLQINNPPPGKCTKFTIGQLRSFNLTA